MSQFPVPLTQLILENLSIVMTFAFSKKPIETLRQSKFPDEWKYFDRTSFTISEQRAEKACIVLAAFIRLLEDDEKVAGYLNQAGGKSFGCIIKKDQPEEALSLSDLTDKIVHARCLEWDFLTTDNPKLICVSRQPEKWVRAEIEIAVLAGFCSQMLS